MPIEAPSPAGSTATVGPRSRRHEPTSASTLHERGIRSMIAVPLRHGDTIVGLLSVLSREPDVFTEEDVGTLELLSVVLSAAISHAAELEAKRSQVEALARFRTVFEGASIGITRADASRRLVEANPALERMLGYTAAELAAMTFRDYTHPDDIERNLELFERADGRQPRLVPAREALLPQGRRADLEPGHGRQRTRRRRRADVDDLDDRGHHPAQDRRGGASAAGRAQRAPGAARRAHRPPEPHPLPRPHPAGDPGRGARRRLASPC